MTVSPELIKLAATIFEVLGPIAVQAFVKAITGDSDPFRDLLDDKVLVTLPSPLRSRIALEAAEAADAARSSAPT